MKKSFCKFLLKLVAFGVILITVDKLLGITILGVKDLILKNNPENRWTKTQYIVEKVDSDVIIIGSSKANHNYNPDIIGDSLRLSVYNCGQDGCFFRYQSCMINMILDRYSPKVIVWDIQPDRFFVPYSIDKEFQNIRHLSPYYKSNIWATSYINSKDSVTKIEMQSNLFAYNSIIRTYLFGLLFKDRNTHKGYDPLANEGKNYPDLLIAEQDDYVPAKEHFDLLSQTIDRCNNQGVSMVLVASPVFIQRTHRYDSVIHDIRKMTESKGVSFYDYLTDPVFLNDSSLFKDVTHLNVDGATLFSQKIIGSITESLGVNDF